MHYKTFISSKSSFTVGTLILNKRLNGALILVETSRRRLVVMLMRGYDVSRESRGHGVTLGNNDRDILGMQKKNAR